MYNIHNTNWWYTKMKWQGIDCMPITVDPTITENNPLWTWHNTYWRYKTESPIHYYTKSSNKVWQTWMTYELAWQTIQVILTSSYFQWKMLLSWQTLAPNEICFDKAEGNIKFLYSINFRRCSWWNLKEKMWAELSKVVTAKHASLTLIQCRQRGDESHIHIQEEWTITAML